MSSQPPLVSIVIPVYNHEKYVEKALHSVFHQTYSNLEVIIIDDGSKDKSASVVEEWLKKRNWNQTNIRQFRFITQENQGAHHTINHGLKIAKGEYLTILNSDDFYDVTRVEKCLNRLQLEERDLIFSAIVGIDDEEKPLPLGNVWRNCYEYALGHLSHKPTVGFQLLESNLAISTGNLFFTRKLYENVGEFKNLKLAHDYDFLMRALLLTEPVFLNEQLYFYRVHTGNTFSQLHDLAEVELKQIYRDYLLAISHSPPPNPQAPCHWYWPLVFSLERFRTKIDRGLSHYLTPVNHEKKSSLDSPSSSSLPQKNRKNKKISLISHDLSLSGGPKVIADLAYALKQQGFRVKVVSYFDGPMKKLLENYQIPVYVLPSMTAKGMSHRRVWIKNGCCLFNSFLLLFKLNRRVVGNTYVTGHLLLILAILNPFYRIFWYLHESYPPSSLLQKKTHLLAKLAKKRRGFHLWFGSHDTRAIWKQSGFEGVTHYWSGLPACHETIKPIDKTFIDILSVGTVAPRKGVHYLIEAFTIGVNEGKIADNVRLTIIGFCEDITLCHEYVGDLILQVVKSGLHDRIRLIPGLQANELEAYYHEADLFVQSSVLECLPLALFQAMSLGLPIVTTDVNGCVEAIEDGKHGYVCSPRNSRILLETILKSLNDPTRSWKMGREAQKHFNEKFCLQKNFESILSHLK